MLYGELVDVATVRDWVAEYPATAAVGGAGLPPDGRPKGRLAAEELLKVFPVVVAAPGDALLVDEALANCCCRAERGLAAGWPIRGCHFSRRSRRLRLGLALALPLPDEPAPVLVPVEKGATPALNRGGVVRVAPPRGDGAADAPAVRKLGDSIVGLVSYVVGWARKLFERTARANQSKVEPDRRRCS